MIEMQATIRNAQGIHCRPSAVIMKETQKYDGEVRVLSDKADCDLRSVMGLLALGLERGEVITIRVDGNGEEEMCKRLVALFETEFDFPPRDG